jgi:hypothetical protein
MRSPRVLSRRRTMALLGGATVAIAACGTSGPVDPTDSSSMGSTTSNGSKVGGISENHRHTAIITAGQLDAGGALLLDITGTSDHPHTVTLSADDVARIRSGERVSRISSNDDRHTHVVTFN